MVPGIQTSRTATPVRVLHCQEGAVVLRKTLLISGSQSRDPLNTGYVSYLRPGLLMGKITSGGKYAPSIIGVTIAAYDENGTNHLLLLVSVATAVELVRRIGASGTFNLVGPPTPAGTVATKTITYSAVDTSTGEITISDTDADFIAGAFIMPEDGSETPLVLIGDGYPIKVTDDDGNDQDAELKMPLIGGQITASQITNWPTDTSLCNCIKLWLNGAVANKGPFIFPELDY